MATRCGTFNLCCPYCLLSCSVDPVLHCDCLVGKREFDALHFFGLWFIYHMSWFLTLPVDVIGRICSVIVALPGHLLYHPVVV